MGLINFKKRLASAECVSLVSRQSYSASRDRLGVKSVLNWGCLAFKKKIF